MQGVYYSQSQDVFIKSPKQARFDFEETSFLLQTLLFLSTVFAFVLPPLAMALVGYALYEHGKFAKGYLRGFRKQLYKDLLAPQCGYRAFIKIGYRLDAEDLPKHLEMLRRLDAKDPQAIKYLKFKERQSKLNPWMQVALSKNQLTTHVWAIGTTGAGKTSFIMQLLKMVAEQGGGMIFIDGKADTQMVFKVYNILKSLGREKDFLLINFLSKGDSRTSSHTFNPIAGMNADEVVELLADALGEPQGEKYWYDRAVAGLRVIVNVLDYRRKYFGESYSPPMLDKTLSDIQRFLKYCAIAVAHALYYENEISSLPVVQDILKQVRTSNTLDNLIPHLHAVSIYFTEKPHESQSYPELDVLRLIDTYNVYAFLDTYIASLSPKFYQGVHEFARQILNKFPQMDVSVEEIFRSITEQISVSPDDEGVRQHGYVAQQWTDLFGTMNKFAHIFGSTNPEVDMLDVIQNNRVLYVLLPALSESPKTVNLLGKLMLASIRKAISYSLGSKVEGLTSRQREILIKRRTPFPVGLLVLDEYGAYPIKGLDVILAQVRSINISTIVSTQDFTSARAEGSDENAVKRIWANTDTKLILKVKDTETLEQLQKLLKEKPKAQWSYQYDPDSGYTHRNVASVNIQKEFLFDPKLIPSFRNGFCFIIPENEPIPTQIYWADAEEAKELRLLRSVGINY